MRIRAETRKHQYRRTEGANTRKYNWRLTSDQKVKQNHNKTALSTNSRKVHLKKDIVALFLDWKHNLSVP